MGFQKEQWQFMSRASGSSWKWLVCGWAMENSKLWEAVMLLKGFSWWSKNIVWARAWMWGKMRVKAHLGGTGGWRGRKGWRAGVTLGNKGPWMLLSIWWHLFFSEDFELKSEMIWAVLYSGLKLISLNQKVPNNDSEMSCNTLARVGGPDLQRSP